MHTRGWALPIWGSATLPQGLATHARLRIPVPNLGYMYRALASCSQGSCKEEPRLHCKHCKQVLATCSPEPLFCVNGARKHVPEHQTSATVPSFAEVRVPLPDCVLEPRLIKHLLVNLSPHDALKHHFTSLKTDLIFLQLTVLEGIFPWNSFTNTWQFS